MNQCEHAVEWIKQNNLNLQTMTDADHDRCIKAWFQFVGPLTTRIKMHDHHAVGYDNKGGRLWEYSKDFFEWLQQDDK